MGGLQASSHAMRLCIVLRSFNAPSRISIWREHQRHHSRLGRVLGLCDCLGIDVQSGPHRRMPQSTRKYPVMGFAVGATIVEKQSGWKSRGRIDRGRGFVKGAIRVPMGSSGRYRCRPLPLVSVSYGFPAHCHGRGRGFEPRRPLHSFQMT
jgi:hypothetical protein